MNLTDYKWSADSTTRKQLIDTVNWPNLQDYASKLHQGKVCSAEAPIGMGGRHFVRILTFEEGDRWLARFPIHSSDTSDAAMLREADCLRIIAERSTVPVPKVFAAVPWKAMFGAAFILMECLPGNVGTDIKNGLVPEQYKSTFFKQMANAQVRKLIQHISRYFMLTRSFLGTSIQYRVSAHRDTCPARKWDCSH